MRLLLLSYFSRIWPAPATPAPAAVFKACSSTISLTRLYASDRLKVGESLRTIS